MGGDAEAGSGNDQDIIYLCPPGEFFGISAGGFDKRIESTVGFGHFIAESGEILVEKVSVLFIDGQVRFHIDTAFNDPLEEGRGADESQGPGGTEDRCHELSGAFDRFRDQDVADALAGQGQGLGPGIIDDGVLIIGGGEHLLRIAVNQFPVGLVGDHVDGVPVCLGFSAQQIGELCHGFMGVDDAGRIVGCVDDEGFGFFGDGLLQFLKIDLEGCHVRFHGNEDAAMAFDEKAVFREIGRHGDDFVAGLGDERFQRDVQRCGSTAGEEHIIPVIAGAEAPVEVVGDDRPGLQGS